MKNVRNLCSKENLKSHKPKRWIARVKLNNRKKLEELLSEEGINLEEESPGNIIQAIREIREEMDTLSHSIWSYAKYLLKFGLASWVFGISSFIASLMVLKGPKTLLASNPLSLALLIGGCTSPNHSRNLSSQIREKKETPHRGKRGTTVPLRKSDVEKVDENKLAWNRKKT